MKPAQLKCPLCNDAVDRLVYRFHYENERVIVDKIKTKHPGWAEVDGICSRCLDYYHTEIVMQQRMLPEIGPYFPVKSADDFIILPTALRLDADPRFTGKGVTICFIDSGFYRHPDLTENTDRIKAIIDITQENSGTTELSEEMWHGTMTSVVCAGDGLLSNGLYKGIASDARLLLIKVQDKNGKISSENIEKALLWILKHQEEFDIRIINISLSGDEDVSYTSSQIDLLAEQLIEKGIVIVAAVGNDPQGCIKPPANAINVIAVGGIDDDNKLQTDTNSMYHSTYGTTIDGLMKPELVAHAIWIAAPVLPGTKEHSESIALHHLLSTHDKDLATGLNDLRNSISLDVSVLQNTDTFFIRDAIVSRIQSCKFISPHYKHVDGTSFAAPIVSAVIAQLLEVNPQLDPSAIREILFSTAERIAGIPAEPQGYGVIQPRKAVMKALKRECILKQHRSPDIDPKRKTIGFYIQHETAAQITLAGSFNQWSRDLLLLQPGKNGIWKIEIPMLPEGKYNYKFFVDDKLWIEDVDNPYREPDGFNGFNSVLFIEPN